MNKPDISYQIESVLLSIASSFPVASSLATGWSQWKNFQQQESIKQLIMNLSQRIQSIESIVDYKLLKSPETKELINNSCMKVRNISNNNKIELYSIFIANSVVTDFPYYKHKDIVLEMIEKIDFFHIKILKLLDKRKNKNWNNELEDTRYFFTRLDNILGYFILYYDWDFISTNLDYLKSLGLIQDTGTPWPNQKSYGLTNLGYNLFNYLSANNLLDEDLLKNSEYRPEAFIMLHQLSEKGFKCDGSLEDFMRFTTDEKKFNQNDARRYFNDIENIDDRIGMTIILEKKYNKK